MTVRYLSIVLLLALVWTTGAQASSYDDMPIWEIRAHPDFVADDYSLSSATNSGESAAEHVYWWIGYIPDGEKRVYFTSFGEPLTCVQWEATGEWVPEWVVEALDKLLAEGYIEL